MKKFLLLIVCFTWCSAVIGQNIEGARKTVDTLTSPSFWGRGYTNDGMKHAAQYIASRFQQAGALPMHQNNYLQHFTMPVNTFPGKVAVTINNQELTAGKNFIVGPGSRSIKAKGKLQQQDSVSFIDPESRLLITLHDKLTWAVSADQHDYTHVMIRKGIVAQSLSSYHVEVDAVHEQKFEAANVCAVMKGTALPDSFIVFTAHYDHLGGMGDGTFFPGANDNASGVALLLDLVEYYAANPPPYSVAFIAFAAEEAGLVGSKYFAENPLLSLPAIRFLLNLDLVGTGSEGITVVNGAEFTQEFEWLKAINDQKQLLPSVLPRGKAANSDHHWFTEASVPSFFIYTRGGIRAYHDVEDIAATLPLTGYDGLFKLIIHFNSQLMGK